MSGGVDGATYRQQMETFDNPKFIEGNALFKLGKTLRPLQ